LTFGWGVFGSLRGLADLLAADKEERAAALEAAGVTLGGVSDVEATLASVPVITMAASCYTEVIIFLTLF
jgi:hypothetical protein